MSHSLPARLDRSAGAAAVLGLLCGALLVALPPRAQAAELRSGGGNDPVIRQGNVHPLARPDLAVGPTAAATPITSLLLLLDPGVEKRQARARFLDAQLDPSSADFHHWLTPQEIGERFGLTAEETAAVSGWLRAHGFAVNAIARSRSWINFSATAGDLDREFKTAMHDYAIDGVISHANAAEPQIPAAIAPRVAGIVGLHDFPLRRPALAKPRGEAAPGGPFYMTPADFATIYQLPAAYTGAGQTIAIVGRSDIKTADITAFRSTYGLPATTPGGHPSLVIAPPASDCPDPGFTSAELEADVDVEWSGAVARDAQVIFVPCGPVGMEAIFQSAAHIVDNNLAAIMSVSFGLCEQLMTTAELTGIDLLWSQAAAQGITVIAASGDLGAAGCASLTTGNPYLLAQGVSGFCSTPFNICVGGTLFDDTADPSLYWSPSGAALGPIREISWKESDGATGGGASVGNSAVAAYAKPEWQVAPGVPADGRRDVPDVSLAAAGHDGYATYSEGQLFIGPGGTSYSAPAFAGIMALVAQKAGQQQGNANPALYQLARTTPGVFRDILTTDNTFDGVQGFACAPGYDQATGLGSIDASALVLGWPTLGVTLAANPAGGTAPFTTELTAKATGEGFGTVNYTFWWDCSFAVSTVAQGVAQCGDPANSAIGAKIDGSSALSAFVLHVYQTAKTYAPLVIVERNAAAVVTTVPVVATSAAACTAFSAAPANAAPGAAAGSQQVALTGSPAGCLGGAWSATGNGSWLTVSPASGSGTGTVRVAWTANAGTAPRSANATLAGHAFAVTQAGTAITPPAAPVLLAPGSATSPGTTIAQLSSGFYWQAVAGADSYHLELSDAVTVQPLQTVAAPQTFLMPATPLLDNHAYKWRMQAHDAAGWGAFGGYFYFSTYTALATGDFSLSASPASGVITAGGSAAFVIGTATTVGSPQTVTFATGALPAGMSASYAAASVQSGAQTTLTLATATGTAPGVFTIEVSATGAQNVTHTTTLGVTVDPAPAAGEPAVCLTPPSLGFAQQMVGTSSAAQLVTLRNCGNGPLAVASLGASPDYFLAPGSIVPPFSLVAGGSTTFQVGFAPLGAGSRPGMVKIFSNAAASPTILALGGSATAAPSTTGTVVVTATLNGQPFSGDMGFSVTGPGGTIDFGNVPLSWSGQGEGSYTVAFIGSPPGGGTLLDIAPAATQPLAGGGSVAFSFDFSAPDDFALSCPTATVTGTTALLVAPVGGSAAVPITAAYQRGAAQTVTLGVTGLPAGATASFTPQPLMLTGATATATLTVTTDSLTPPGLYQLTVTGTNQDGSARTVTGTLVVASAALPSLVSTGTGPSPSNGFSDLPVVSGDGRYVAFYSLASNLVAGDTNGAADVFVRDLQSGAMSRVSVASDGTQGSDFSGQPAISADGRFVAFMSRAGNLVPAGRAGFADIYVHDQQLGQTVQADLSTAGVPPDGGAADPAISGNGRFVAFDSNSTNLAAGGGGGRRQIYVRDLQAGQTSLISIAADGTPGDADSTNPAISGDGRFVAFFSAASNLGAAGATSAGRQVFLFDRQTAALQLASGPADGSAANDAAYLDSEERLAISLDGRYVAFTSLASNLVPGDANAAPDVFVWDRQTATTQLVSVASDGTLFYGGGGAPAISADGRFIAFRVFVADAPAQEIAVRDMVARQTVLYSLGPGPVAGSASSVTTALSGDGRTLAFSSNAANLVPGDTNGQQDIFSLVLPASGTAYARTIAITPASLAGGMIATGTVTLSASAPAGGAAVGLYSSSAAAEVPALVMVPAGSTAASFSVPTLAVSAELSANVVASYGGGSPWALLLLEPGTPAHLELLQGDNQTVPVGSALPIALSVRVLDAGNNPLPNVAVQFSAPATGPSGTFAGGTATVVVSTDATGTAAAPVFTANRSLGPFAVVASTAGVALPVVFNVQNRGLLFYTLAPCRLVDTRGAAGPLAGPALAPGAQRTFPLTGTCGIPTSAKVLSLNVTAVVGAAAGDVRLFAGDQTAPTSTTINWNAGQVRANNATVSLAGNGAGTINALNDSTGAVNFLIDVNGYYQ